MVMELRQLSLRKSQSATDGVRYFADRDLKRNRAISMVMELRQGFRRKMLWFPAKNVV